MRARVVDGAGAAAAPRRGILFPAPQGGRIDINNFRHRSWTPALAAAGVEHRRIYDLRHTYATWSLAAGVDIFTLARRMGTSVKMIDRTYGHLVAGADEYERELLDAFDERADSWTRCGRAGGPKMRRDLSPTYEKSPAVAGLPPESGSDGTRTRDLRRDRPAL